MQLSGGSLGAGSGGAALCPAAERGNRFASEKPFEAAVCSWDLRVKRELG